MITTKERKGIQFYFLFEPPRSGVSAGCFCVLGVLSRLNRKQILQNRDNSETQSDDAATMKTERRNLETNAGAQRTPRGWATTTEAGHGQPACPQDRGQGNEDQRNMTRGFVPIPLISIPLTFSFTEIPKGMVVASLPCVSLRLPCLRVKPLLASLLLCVFALMPVGLSAVANDLSGLLQKGLFEEEANRNLEAAAQAYATVSAQFDKDRKIAATAIFRLGEIYRKQGKTNEAAGQYERIVREFADQDTLVTLSRQNLVGLGTGRTNKTVSESKTSTPDLELLQRIKALPSTEFRRIMPILSLDPTLVELLAMLNESQAKYAQQFVNGTNANPAETAQLLSAQTAISGKIDYHIGELIKGMELRAANNTGAQPTSQTSSDSSLTTATDDEEKEIRRIQAMIQNSPDLINAPGSAGFTPLHTAAFNGQLTVARFLLDNKANVNARNNNQETPLTLAAMQGHKAMVELLLSRGAEVNAPGGAGYTALHYAAKQGFNALAETLTANQAAIDARNQAGITPLHLAAAGGHATLAESLLNRGADVNAVDKSGQTPLFNAAVAGHSAMIKVLLAAKAKLDVVDNNGCTALSFASEKGHLDCVQALRGIL